MRWERLLAVVCATVGVLWAGAAGAQAAGTGSYVLSTTSFGGRYAPTFSGNGRLGIRVPPTGQGYADGTVPAQAQLAGFYAQPTNPPKVSESVQQRASIPNWSTLTFSDGGQAFSLSSGRTTNWRQSIDLHTGIITTSADWQAPDGHVTQLTYQVLTDRASEYVGLVSLTLTPQWSGQATVTDLIDGSPQALSGGTAPVLTNPVSSGNDAGARQQWVTIAAQTTGIQATIASQLGTSANVTGAVTPVAEPPESAAQQITFPVTEGQQYTITKYVGIGDSQDTGNTVAAALATASQAAAAGWDALVDANNAAWSQLWNGRVDVVGNNTLATDVNASEFYLWSSTRDGVDWSVSPAGLSSNGYDGHIFWDAETWMFPSLLAQHPDLALGMENYRFQRLPEAEQHATATGYKGARFPWESALDGTEQIPPPVSVNSEGLFEQHITADVALAQWQYYLATGDGSWLANNGWPVLSGAADFWASRAVLGRDGKYHIDNVTGPDEENPDVNDEAYTNTAAAVTLRDAISAAQVLGITPPSNWSQIAAGLVVPVNSRLNIHPEFSGYRGQLVKQADVTMLQYPWARPMSRSTALADLNYYVPRTDPGGPSMSDAINSIDTSALGTPGCSSYVFTERSFEPFIRDPFDQFSETSTGGAFTFMTGIGGFLQEFLYGYSGMRFGSGSVAIAPSMSGQLGGIVLNDVNWRGRVFNVSIGVNKTTVTLISGAPLPLSIPQGNRVVPTGGSVTIRSARPEATPTSDLVRCDQAKASTAAPGAPALAAVDGSTATPWSPTKLPATLTAPLRRSSPIGRVVIVWGRQWPPAPAPNVKPPTGPVITRRATVYKIQVSTSGRHWRTIKTVRKRSGLTDTLTFKGVKARYVRVWILSSTKKLMPLLEELTVLR
jgi:trehalose/maltose hydrolase-like predicted phosphorylase